MSKPICKFESIENRFNFGKYNGLSLSDVMEINPSYLEWCLSNCEGVHILIEDNVISQLRMVFPEYPITDSFVELCEQRQYAYDEEINEEVENDFRNYIDNNEPDTYSRYAGSYAQDEMGYSDDDIDTIFDGDPSAYWNID